MNRLHTLIASAIICSFMLFPAITFAGDTAPSGDPRTDQRTAMAYVDSLAPDMPVAMQKALRGEGWFMRNGQIYRDGGMSLEDYIYYRMHRMSYSQSGDVSCVGSAPCVYYRN